MEEEMREMLEDGAQAEEWRGWRNREGEAVADLRRIRILP